MLTTAKIIEMIRKDNIRNGLPSSNYYVAKTLGVSPQSINSLNKTGTVLNDTNAMKAASLLGLNPDYVLASLQAERARNEPSAPIWRMIAHRLEGAAAALVVLAITINMPIF